MSYRCNKMKQSGFTLIELLVVVAILGLVTLAMFSLFENVRGTAGTQDEVVDLQQNMRVAMDTLTNDIQMAGFLVPPTANAIDNAPTDLSAGNLRIRTATTSVDVARLDGVVNVSAAEDVETFTLATAEMVRLFAVNDKVRLIRSPDHGQKIDSLLNVDATDPDPAVRTVTLSNFGAASTSYQEVDLLVKTSSAHPAAITYDIAGNQLRRTLSDGGGAQVVADNITNVEFVYRLEDGSETNAPAAVEDIRGVRVTIKGEALDMTTKGTKARWLTKLITLKNDL